MSGSKLLQSGPERPLNAAVRFGRSNSQPDQCNGRAKQIPHLDQRDRPGIACPRRKSMPVPKSSAHRFAAAQKSGYRKGCQADLGKNAGKAQFGLLAKEIEAAKRTLGKNGRR